MPSTFAHYRNNFRTVLAQPHAIGDGEFVLAAGAAATLGALPADRIYRITAATSPGTNQEVVKGVFEATGINIGANKLTGVTAATGYADVALPAGTPILLRTTAESLNDLGNAINSVEVEKLSSDGIGDDLTVQPVGATQSATLADHLGVTLDAKHGFGAVGDGNTNDWQAIQAACDAVKNAGGGTVVLPPTSSGYLIRRPIVLGSYTTLQGFGRNTRITRPASTIRSLAANATQGATTVSVADTSGFVVGYGFSIWDDESATNSWPTRAVITSVVTNTSVTFDTPLLANYSTTANAKCGTVFPLILNEADSQGVRVTGLALDGNKQAGDSVVKEIFQFSLVDWMKSYNGSVDHCWLLNSLADGYSDQANDWSTPLVTTQLRTRNRCQDNVIDSPARHGVHLGTFMDGAFVLNNAITNCGSGVTGGGIFYCAGIRNTLFAGNNVYNVAQQGVVGLDSRDTHNRIQGNFFERCALGGVGLVNSKYNLVQGNTIKDCGTAAIHTSGATDCQIIGNMCTAVDPYTPVIELNNSTRLQVAHNDVQGGASGTRGIAVYTCTDSIVDSNVCLENAFAGIELYNSTRVRIVNNTVVNPTSTIGLKIFSPNTDVILDNNQYSGAAASVDWDVIPVRLVQNGIGDNGSSDPASAGDWNSINSLSTQGKRAHNGRRVKWSNGGTPTISTFWEGAWIDVPGS